MEFKFKNGLKVKSFLVKISTDEIWIINLKISNIIAEK